MYKKLLPSLLLLWSTSTLHAQFQFSDVAFWTGSGPDSTVLIVDFKDGTDDSSYAWGYRYSGTATGSDLLQAVATADVNFSINVGGGFLNDISYHRHQGLGGQPDFWGTWDGMNPDSLSSNAGLVDTLIPGGFYGCSYTDFNPAVAPGTPWPAYKPDSLQIRDLQFFIGSGPDTAMLVIDFQDTSQSSSLAWGYLFQDSVDGESILQDIAAVDPQLSVAMGGGFLNDITYNNLSGIGGSPDFWGTWSATNLGDWAMNAGLGTTVLPGEFFGCSYTDFAPALRPGYPTAAPPPVSLPETAATTQVSLYPQPARDAVTLRWAHAWQGEVEILDSQGRKLRRQHAQGRELRMSLGGLAPGAYFVRWGDQIHKLWVQ